MPVVAEPKAGLLAVFPPKSDDPVVPPPKGLDVDALFVLDAPKPPKPPPPEVAVVEPPNKPPPEDVVVPKPPGLAPNAPVFAVDPNAPGNEC